MPMNHVENKLFSYLEIVCTLLYMLSKVKSIPKINARSLGILCKPRLQEALSLGGLVMYVPSFVRFILFKLYQAINMLVILSQVFMF